MCELCILLDLSRPDPTSPDNSQNSYVFERAVTRKNPDGTATTGFIDLYRRGSFVWECKQGTNVPGESDNAPINRTLQGWFAYFKHIQRSQLEEIDQWTRMRLRSILRKRRGGKGRGRGQDHHRWPNRYFTGLGLFCLLDAKVTETASLRYGANH